MKKKKLKRKMKKVQKVKKIAAILNPMILKIVVVNRPQ